MTAAIIEDEGLSNAPKCFGLAVAYSRKSKVCEACGFAPRCAPRADAMIAMLREKLGMAPIASKKATVSAAEVAGESVASAGEHVQESVATVTAAKKIIAPRAANEPPKKAADLIARLTRMGIDVRSLFDGRTVFPSELPLFVGVTCNKIIAGPFTRAELRETMMGANPTWSANTASSHVSFTVAAFLHLGIIQDIDGKLTRIV